VVVRCGGSHIFYEYIICSHLVLRRLKAIMRLEVLGQLRNPMRSRNLGTAQALSVCL
jgi:hypothetical protein